MPLVHEFVLFNSGEYGTRHVVISRNNSDSYLTTPIHKILYIRKASNREIWGGLIPQLGLSSRT